MTLFNARQLAEELGLSPWTICGLRKLGLPFPFGGRTTREAALKWLVANPGVRGSHAFPRRLKAGKVVRQAEINRVSGRDSGLNTIKGLMFWFERWLKSVGGERDILAWPVDTREDWLREVNPILNLAAKVMKTLPVDAEVIVEHDGSAGGAT